MNEVLASLSAEFESVYYHTGRPSIPPEKLLRALLLQAFYSIRSERQLMGQLDFNLLVRGLGHGRRSLGGHGILQEQATPVGGGGVGEAACGCRFVSEGAWSVEPRALSRWMAR